MPDEEVSPGKHARSPSPFCLACFFFAPMSLSLQTTHKGNKSSTLWRATYRVQWPSRETVRRCDKSGREAWLTSFSSQCNPQVRRRSRCVWCVWCCVFLVTTNVWFWCVGVVFKKDEFQERHPNLFYCDWNLKCGMSVQRRTGIITFLKPQCNYRNEWLWFILSIQAIIIPQGVTNPFYSIQMKSCHSIIFLCSCNYKP